MPTDRFGSQWAFHEPARDEMARVARGAGGLTLAGRGCPADSRPLTCGVGDRAYQVEVTIECH
jgi:xylan 1,4-beta-xylosidase